MIRQIIAMGGGGFSMDTNTLLDDDVAIHFINETNKTFISSRESAKCYYFEKTGSTFTEKIIIPDLLK